MYVRNAHGEYSKIGIDTSGFCSVKGCFGYPCDESHIRKCDINGNLSSDKVYVVKLCTKHNRSKNDDVMELDSDALIYPINP